MRECTTSGAGQHVDWCRRVWGEALWPESGPTSGWSTGCGCVACGSSMRKCSSLNAANRSVGPFRSAGNEFAVPDGKCLYSFTTATW